MKLHHYPIILLVLATAAARAAESTPPITPAIIDAAEHGEADAQYQLARAYLRGEGLPKDLNKAYELMKSAAAKGQADALGGLGYFYSAGLVVKKDDKVAADWFRQGAEKGSAKAQFNLSKWLLSGKGGAAGATPEKLREESLQWLQKAADQGLPEAGLAYGSILYFGDHGVTQDYAKAAPYFKQAAEHGLRNAQNFYGILCDNGFGIPVDKAAAEQWYRKAALQGHVKAQSNLGCLLYPHDDNKAARLEALAWLIMATNQGEVTAEKMLLDVTPGLEEGEMNQATKRAAELRQLVR